MNCPNCNAQNDNTADVCIVCGEPLDTEAVITEDKSAKLEELKLKRLRKQKNKKIKKAAIIIILIAAVLAAAVWAFYNFENIFFGKTNNGDTYVIPSPTPTIAATPEATPEPTPQIVPEETEEPLPQATEEIVLPAQTAKPQITVVPPATKKPVKKPAPTVRPAVTSPGFVAGSVTQSAVTQGQNINSTLVTVTAIETAAETGSSIARFKIGNETYFAYASAEDFNGTLPGMYSIDASPTGDVYYGLPVYKITRIDSYSKDDYIIPDSSTKVLTEADLQGLSKSQLELARNEIFARHGRTFKRQEVQKYFESKSWYSPSSSYNYSNDYKNLTETELKNAKFILEFENR